jgi:hypothetical protein
MLRRNAIPIEHDPVSGVKRKCWLAGLLRLQFDGA